MTPPLTTAPQGRAAAKQHPRGVYEADHTFPGLRTFRVYDCDGRLLERREVAFTLADAHTRASLELTLEHYCPADPKKHAAKCPGARVFPLRVLK